MKKMKKIFLLLSVLSLVACNKETIDAEISDSVLFLKGEPFQNFNCVFKQADNPPKLPDAQKWLVGRWQLKGMITQAPSGDVPNIKIEFKEDGGVFIHNAGKLVFTNAYSINLLEENGYKSIVITTDDFGTDFNEHNILRGTLRICEDELMIDNGIAFDAPGYLFRKI